MKRPALLLAIAAAVAWAGDALTKAWAESTLLVHDPVPVWGDAFRVTLGYNPGVAFGMLSGGGVGVLLLNGIVLLVLLGWVTVSLRAGELPRRVIIPVGLLLGGALANFSDRLADGRVTDFIDVGLGATRWPTFNLADAFIVIGAFGLALWLSRDPSSRRDGSALPTAREAPSGGREAFTTSSV